MINNKTKPKLKHKLIVIFSCFFALILSAIIFLYFSSVKSWKNFDINKIKNAGQTLQIYDNKNELIANVHGGENRFHVDIAQIPDHVKNAFIATEDLRFYSHSGIDTHRIMGALVADIKSGSFDQGASTITQQLIKLSHLTSEKKYLVKSTKPCLRLSLSKTIQKMIF